MSVKYDYTMRQNMYGSISNGEQLTIVLNRKKLLLNCKEICIFNYKCIECNSLIKIEY